MLDSEAAVRDSGAGRIRTWLGDAGAILVGAALLAVLVPALQWLDRGSFGSNAELDVPNPAGVTLLLAAAVLAGVVGAVAKLRVFPARRLLLLYTMFAAGLPFCSVGLVAGLHNSITAVASEYLDRQIPTIRRGYEFQDPAFVPKIPEEHHDQYVNLSKKVAEGDEDAATRIRELLLPLKRYWSGVYSDPAERARFAEPGFSLWEGIRLTTQTIPWRIWGPPLVSWMAFFMAVVAGTMALAHLLADDWTQRENLPFPVAQVPALLLDPPATKATYVSNAYFWSGALTGGILLALGGMTHYGVIDADMQTMPVTFQRIDFRYVLGNYPWTALSNNLLVFSPLLVGIAYLVHQEVLKGVVGTFLALQGVRLVAGMAEVPLRNALGSYWRGNEFPYYPELGTGAAVLFALVLVFRAIPRSGRGSERLVPLWWRTAPWAVLAASLLAIGFFWYRLGASGWGGLWVVAVVLVWTLLGGIALARARAEAGLAQSSTFFLDSRIGLQAGGSQTLAFPNLFTFGHSFILVFAAFPGLLATHVESLYLSRRLGRRADGAVGSALLVGFFTAAAVGIVSYLVMAYWQGSQNFAHVLQDRAKQPFWGMFITGEQRFDRDVQVLRLLMIPLGACIMGALLYIRRKRPRFPLPPICLLVVCLGTATIHQAIDTPSLGLYRTALQGQAVCIVWGPMLIALLAKSLVLRYGGMHLYTRSAPAAHGLVVAHAVMIVLWSVYHALAAQPGESIFTGVL